MIKLLKSFIHEKVIWGVYANMVTAESTSWKCQGKNINKQYV